MGEVVPLSAAARDQDDPLRALVICKSALLSRARADDQFSDAEYRIYAAALDYTHRELDEYFGMLWPSVSKLARDAGGKGRRTVQRALTKFVTLEYLHLVSDRRGGRRKAPNGSAVATAFYALPGIRIDSSRHGHSAADAPVNSATDAPINSATEAPQSYREEPMEETSVSRARGAKGPRLQERVGSLLAPDWQPSSDDVLLAEQLGLDAVAVALQFRDYWIAVPDPKGRKADWSATWRNWCRRERGTTNAADRRPGSVVAAAHAAIAFGPLRSGVPAREVTRVPAYSDDEWREILRQYKAAGSSPRSWNRSHGLPPTHVATRVPRHLVEEFDL